MNTQEKLAKLKSIKQQLQNIEDELGTITDDGTVLDLLVTHIYYDVHEILTFLSLKSELKKGG